jgi:hypothetical protein
VQTVEATSMPWIVRADSPGCAAVVATGMRTGPGRCPHPVASFMLVRYPAGGGVWCAFLCAGHSREMGPLAEPLDQVATAELADRRVQHALAMAGKPCRPPAPLQTR